MEKFNLLKNSLVYLKILSKKYKLENIKIAADELDKLIYEIENRLNIKVEIE